MFGGNPGGRQGKDENVRLGDFWKLTLERPSREEVLRQCRLLIRQGHFSEMAIVDKVAAVSYLQTRLSEIVDHRNSEEEATVRCGLRSSKYIYAYRSCFSSDSWPRKSLPLWRP